MLDASLRAHHERALQNVMVARQDVARTQPRTVLAKGWTALDRGPVQSPGVKVSYKLRPQRALDWVKANPRASTRMLSSAFGICYTTAATMAQGLVEKGKLIDHLEPQGKKLLHLYSAIT
jgi:hypothetical protein